MSRALSEDLRSRVISAVDGGMSRRSAAERFGIGVATAIRWLRSWRNEGRASAMPVGGDKRSYRIEAYRDVILGAIEAQKDITLDELVDLLRREHGASFARSTIWRFLDRHGITFKKNGARQRAAASGRPPAPPCLVRGAA